MRKKSATETELCNSISIGKLFLKQYMNLCVINTHILYCNIHKMFCKCT